MITVAAPGFLVAGGLLAAIPIALHLLSRRPPSRAALPTARFLAEDPRTLLRLRRTPTDLPLLGVRVLFALALGAAFAGLRWAPEREGLRRVILVDAGADDRVAWGEVAEAVDRVAAGALPTGRDPSASDAAEPPLVIAYGLDDGAAVVAAEGLEHLTRGSRPATLEDGLRALRREAARSRFAEAEVSWVGRASWRIWSPGVGLLRPALWPGRVRLRSVEEEGAGGPPAAGGSAPASDAARPRPPVVEIAVPDPGDALARAVLALGGGLFAPGTELPGAPEELPDADGYLLAEGPPWIIAETGPERGLESWLPRVRGGATLLAFGEPGAGVPDLPWSVDPLPAGAAPAPGPPRESALVLLPGGRAVGDPVTPLPGRPASGARTVLTFDDGTAAAAARELEEGCVVFAAADLTRPALTASPAYPELIRRLLFACRDPDFGDGPLNRGAREALERADLPETVEVAAVLAPEGRPWTRWLLLAALLFLAAEWALTRPGPARVRTTTGGDEGR